MSETASSGARIPPSRQLVAALVLALANFMVILDLTIANVSIPHVAGNLGITLEQGAWIITSYAVAEAICVPSDRLDRRPLRIGAHLPVQYDRVRDLLLPVRHIRDDGHAGR
jgi:MFS family permease